MSTNIEWCDEVWNPITGCTPISSGCDNCYAKRMANRLKGRFGYPLDNPFAITLHENRLALPFHWKKPRRIFVDSMGDLFHNEVPFSWIDRVFKTIAMNNHHTFLILTKRPQRMKDYFNRYSKQYVHSNIWAGVSVEDDHQARERIPILLDISASKRFISAEPLLSGMYIHPYLDAKIVREYGEPSADKKTWPVVSSTTRPALDWVICGAENAQKARPINPADVHYLLQQCQGHNVPFFFKGWGNYKGPGDFNIPAGCLIDGREYKELPA